MSQTKGLNRDTIDKFYTKPEIVDLCFDLVTKKIKFEEGDTVIEPSAGGGAFIEHIKKITNNYIFLDIKPDHPDVSQQDYLTYEIPNTKNNYHVVGNPPFGRQSSLAIKFIKKSCEYAKSISFVLPKSFKKESMKKHFHECFHLIEEIDLPKNSFTLNNKDCNVPCLFQIWIKKDTPREKPIKEEPSVFNFVKKKDADVSFRRVGVKAGCVSTDIETKSEQSHYFIKFNKDVDEMIQIMTSLTFDSDNTVGPKSISKQELIKKMNRLTDRS